MLTENFVFSGQVADTETQLFFSGEIDTQTLIRWAAVLSCSHETVNAKLELLQIPIYNNKFATGSQMLQHTLMKSLMLLQLQIKSILAYFKIHYLVISCLKAT